MIISRTARQYSQSNVYHIILRGIDRQDIFYEDIDRYVFKTQLKTVKDDYKYEIYSYCLMNNHVHLVIRVNKKNLSISIKSLAIRYSMYFNKKYDRTGHLFENRFRSKNVETREYFLELCRYVHRNPENALIEKVDKYKWSSYQEYIGKNELVNTKILLHYFSDDIDNFISFMNVSKYDKKKYLEYELIERISDDELINLIKEKYNLECISEISEFNKRKRDELIMYLREIEISNITQVSRVTKICRNVVKRLWK